MISDSNLIKSKFLNTFDPLWKSMLEDGQVFYDNRAKIFTFRKGYEFYIKPFEVIDSAKIKPMKIPINERIMALSYSKKKNYVAIQTGINMIKIYNIPLTREHKIQLKAPSKEKMTTIQVFEWLWNSSTNVHFAVAEILGIHLYSFDEEKHNMKSLTFIQNEAPFTWFEPINEIFIMANTKGAVQTFFVDQFSKGEKKIKGQNFLLDIRSDAEGKISGDAALKSTNLKPQKPFNPRLSNRNKDLNFVDTFQNDANANRHMISFVNIYGNSTVIHVNNYFGKVYIYNITYNAVELFEPIMTVPCEGIYNLNIVDNIIILHNTIEKISFIYDVINDSAIRKPSRVLTLGSTNQIYIEKVKEEKMPVDQTANSNIEPKANSEINIEENDNPKNEDNLPKKSVDTAINPLNNQEEKNENLDITQTQSSISTDESKTIQNEVNIVTDSKTIPNDSEENPTKNSTEIKIIDSTSDIVTLPNKFNVEQCALYEANTRSLENDLIIDLDCHCLHKLELQIETIPKLIDYHSETFKAILRRENGKQPALKYALQLLDNHDKITTFSMIFIEILHHYRKELDERTKREAIKEKDEKGSRNTLTNINKFEENVKNQNLIYQTDLYNVLFKKVADDNERDKDFLIEVILEFMRIVLEHELPIINTIQSLFLQLVLKQKKFVLLNFLLQFRCLHDSIDLAEVLIKLGSNPKTSFKRKKKTKTKEKIRKFIIYSLLFLNSALERPSNEYCKLINDEDYYPPVLQLGLDMLFRMKKIKELIDYFLGLGKIIDAIELIKKENFANINIQNFLECVRKPNSDCTLNDLLSFIQVRSKKMLKSTDRREYLAFSDEIINQINEIQEKNQYEFNA